MNENRRQFGSDPAGVFAQLAEIVYARSGYEDIYAIISRTAVDVIPGCDHACISSLKAGQELVNEASSDSIAALIDSYERDTGEGPCLDAIVEESFQHDPDITVRSTWPELTRLTLANTPVRGMIGYRLRVGERKAGALNVFSDTPGALTQESADIGAIVAAFASVTLAGAASNERAEQLQRGLASNREIGKAVGLLMATHDVNETDAFGVLRRASSELNVKLADIARRVVDEHESRE